jgi:hypothetical protein
MTTTSQTPLEAALDYYDRGLMPIPVHRVIAHREGKPICSCGARDGCASPGKHPTMTWSQFQKRRPPREEVADWWSGDRARYGVGILTGSASGNIFVLDVDVGPGKDGDDSLRALQLAHDDLPETAEVRTGGGGLHLYFRAPPGVAVVRNSASKLGPGLDIRGEGGFVVAPPSVHASGQPYVWSWINTLAEGIADAPAWLLDLVRAEPVIGATPRDRVASSPPPSSPVGAGSLGVLPPAIEDGREEYMRDTVFAVALELTGENGAWPTAEEVYEVAWPQFLRRVDLSRPGRITRDNAEAEMRAKCAQIAAKAENGGMGALEDVVAAYQAKRREQPRQGPGNRQEEAAGEVKRDEPPEPPPEDLGREFVLRPPQQIPLRRWLYGDTYIRSFVSVLAAPGGAGKTTLYVAEALAIATGRPLVGITPAERTGVWIMNLEDPADEMERRIGAAAIHYGIRQEDIAGRLLVDAGRDKPLTTAHQTRDGVVIHQPMIDAIVEVIRRKKIGVVIVDPFVASHAVSENDNQAINAVVASWRLIADMTGCCVVLVHHFRKLNGEEGSIDSVRGGSAMIGAVRTARVMNVMSDAEAARLGIEEADRRRYVRIDNAKNNLAPPAASAQWIELRSVDLGNGSGISPHGDKVGVAVPWQPPSAWEGITAGHARDVWQFLAKNGPRRKDPQATAWFGFDVMTICGLEQDDRNKARVVTLLNAWEKSGIITSAMHPDERRKKAPHYEAGKAPEPDDR